MKKTGMIAAITCLLVCLGAVAWGGGDASSKAGKPLEPPTALKLVIVKNTFQLTWTPSPQDPGIVTGYEIFRSANVASGPFVKIGAVEKGVAQYTDKTAAPENIYYFKIRALAGSAKSPYSNTVTGER